MNDRKFDAVHTHVGMSEVMNDAFPAKFWSPQAGSAALIN